MSKFSFDGAELRFRLLSNLFHLSDTLLPCSLLLRPQALHQPVVLFLHAAKLLAELRGLRTHRLSLRTAALCCTGQITGALADLVSGLIAGTKLVALLRGGMDACLVALHRAFAHLRSALALALVALRSLVLPAAPGPALGCDRQHGEHDEKKGRSEFGFHGFPQGAAGIYFGGMPNRVLKNGGIKPPLQSAS